MRRNPVAPAGRPFCYPGRVAVLSPILAGTPDAAIGDVVACMTAIDQVLPPGDGISCFNRLYLGVTQKGRAAVGTTACADAPAISPDRTFLARAARPC